LSITDAGWIAFLSYLETQIGRDNFDRTVKKYQEMREQLIERPTS